MKILINSLTEIIEPKYCYVQLTANLTTLRMILYKLTGSFSLRSFNSSLFIIDYDMEAKSILNHTQAF